MNEKSRSFITSSEEESREVAKQFGKQLCSGDIVLYTGDVGAGKTVFTQGVCSALDVDDYVNSPSYILLNTYQSPKFEIYHYDLYRISTIDELTEIGYYEFVGKEGGITLIEWSELLGEERPRHYYEVSISVLGVTKREIVIRKV
jgi:tRNA threonylcarbamoyladenosine biosynthesis protein TsaE